MFQIYDLILHSRLCTFLNEPAYSLLFAALGENMPVQYFPSLVCLIGYAMSYASGSAMGTQGSVPYGINY